MWLYDTSVGLEVVIVLSCGATYRTTPDVWQSGNYLASNNQVNFSDNVANEIRLADICLVEDNEGQTREPEFQLAGRDLFEELQLCQRYFQKSYNITHDPGTVTNEGAFAFQYNGTSFDVGIIYPTRMRVAATPAVYSPGSGASGNIRNDSTVADNAATTAFYGENSFRVFNTSSGSAGNRCNVHYTADAEL
jgi:hypothetical protein